MSGCQSEQLALLGAVEGYAWLRCGLEVHSPDLPHRFVMEWFGEVSPETEAIYPKRTHLVSTERTKVEASIAIPMPPVEFDAETLGTIEHRFTVHNFFCETHRWTNRGYDSLGFCDTEGCDFNAHAARAVGRA